MWRNKHCRIFLQKGFNDVIKMATEIHSLRFGALSPNFALHKSLQKIIDLYIPEDISDAQDRLYVSLTDQKVKFLHQKCFYLDLR